MNLGEKHKALEHAERRYLPRRTNTLIRLDGKAFHSYTRGVERPFSTGLSRAMQETMLRLCEGIQGCQLGYTQSDEISLLLTDYERETTDSWYGGNIQKITSVAASMATAFFNEAMRQLDFDKKPEGLAFFDARVWTIPDLEDVYEYYRWRQIDCTKNSISMAAQSLFSHRDLQGLNRDQLKEKMLSEKGLDWNDYPAEFKYGSYSSRHERSERVTYRDPRTGTMKTTPEPVTRRHWVVEAASEDTFRELYLNSLV
jgi:tRNA(His) 5'-end guanylyltransferase